MVHQLSYCEMYFKRQLSPKEETWYIKHCRKWLKQDFDKMMEWSPHIAWKLRAIYELVVDKANGEIKPLGGWLKTLYRIVGRIDREFETTKEKEPPTKKKSKPSKGVHTDIKETLTNRETTEFIGSFKQTRRR